MSDYADPFFGSEARDLPEPRGLAASWFYIKAQIGNTHPGAGLPHDPVTALPYSGGYPTGYGVYAPNASGPPERMHRRKCLYGISHVQQSGTGAIGFYYNFLLTRPYLDSPSVPPLAITDARPAGLDTEEAAPGFYSCSVSEWDTRIDLVAADNAVVHRYTPLSTEMESRGLLIDVTHGGLAESSKIARPAAVRLERRSSGVEGSFVHYGITWYFAVLPDESAVDGPAELWKVGADRAPGDASQQAGWIPVSGMGEVDRIDLEDVELGNQRAGCLWRWNASKPLDIFVGLSQDSVERARAYAVRAQQDGYETRRRHAEAVWKESFGRIATEGGSEETRYQFYSSWLHASRKPVLGEASNFLWRDGPRLWTDVATMWDQSKTLIPFLATFYPEEALSLARSLHKTGEHYGQFPAAVVSSSNQKTFERQSRNLAVLIICEIFHHVRIRGLCGDDLWIAMLPFLDREVKREYEAVADRDMVNSHILDISYAAHCLTTMAENLGQRHYSAGLAEISASWRKAIDPATGYMKKGGYYEGDYVHYSFRLLHRMKERIDLCGGPAQFEQMLDRFFGYGAEPVRQISREMSQRQGESLGRFDGLNNEVMMETPFAYHFVGRPDKTNEVVHGIRKYHFYPSPGGLVGNDDSGALTSWYIWNALGLFPMVGNGLFFVSLPLWDRSEITNCGFHIRKIEKSHEGGEPIYPEQIILNGTKLDRSYVYAHEVLAGGHLEIHLADTVRAKQRWSGV